MLRVPSLTTDPGTLQVKGAALLADPCPGHQSQAPHNERAFHRRESGLCSATESPGHLSPLREGAEKDPEVPPERAVSW